MANRDFTVGDTVHWTLRANQPGTRDPANPEPTVVRMTKIVQDGAEIPLPDTVDFTRVSAGLYRLSLATGALTPGVYQTQALVSRGPEAVVQVRDTFVLAASL